VTQPIALFPLHHVLLPGMPLPLHLFEPRYRQLLADVSGAGGPRSFGVVSLRRGAEVGATVTRETDLAAVGTLAEILEIERAPDGTADLLTIGSRRFRVQRLVDGAPYLRAEVSWLEERDGDVRPAHVAVARHLYADLRGMLAELTGRGSEADSTDLPRDATALSYQLAGQVPLSSADRLAVLAADTTAERLRILIGVLRREIVLTQRTRSVAIAPSALRLPAQVN
jgi:Lon protease-like protein